MKITDIDDLSNKYRTIYVDPPWGYNLRTFGRFITKGIRMKGAMSLDDVCNFPINLVGHPEGFIIFMWYTWPEIQDGYHLNVLKAWNLRWSAEIVWDKVDMGAGRFVKSRTEVLMIASSPPDGPQIRPLRFGQPDLVSVKGGGQQKTKPPEFRRIIETLSPGPRIELFAREHPAGWDVWGHDAPDEQTVLDETRAKSRKK